MKYLKAIGNSALTIVCVGFLILGLIPTLLFAFSGFILDNQNEKGEPIAKFLIQELF